MDALESARQREIVSRFESAHLAQGLCVSCPKPLATNRYCRKCADRRAELNRQYRTRPEVKQKRAAREAVRRAVNRGDIAKPSQCQRCSAATELQAHHQNGYEGEARLQVEWICGACHGVENRRCL